MPDPRPLTRAERLALIGRPLLYPEHQFHLPRPDWEAAVFDNAAHFLTVDFAVGLNHAERRCRWPTFPQARSFAGERGRVCIYAVTATDLSTILERKAWDAWEERWKRRK